jgi:pimeloyl-ACP methyl ester carboxylesterase
MVEALVELKEMDIAYLESGSGSPTLLCLHGIQSLKETYQSWARSSLAQRNRIVIPDIPGFGSSRMPSGESFELGRQAERLIAFIDSLGLERLVVYGHSLGGMLGTLLLERIPERIEGLVSAEGNLRLQDCGESRRVAALSFEEFEATRYLELRKRGVQVDAWAFYSTCRAVVDLAASERLYRCIADSLCPVLFIRGGRSHFASVPSGRNVRNIEIAEETHATLPTSKGLLEALWSFLSKSR